MNMNKIIINEVVHSIVQNENENECVKCSLKTVCQSIQNDASFCLCKSMYSMNDSHFEVIPSFIVQHLQYETWSDWQITESSGKAHCRVYSLDECPGIGYLAGVYVCPQDRRQHIGTSMVKEAEKVCLQNQLTTCMLWCDSDTFVKPWYESLGFEVESKYYDTNKVWMKKIIK